MLYIFLLPIIGLALAFIINKIFPRAQFRGYDVLPFFFIAACSLITLHRNKNISLGKTIRKLWDYLAACTCFWYLGLLIMMFL